MITKRTDNRVNKVTNIQLLESNNKLSHQAVSRVYKNECVICVQIKRLSPIDR